MSFSGELRDHQLANGLGLNENQKDAAFLYLINQWVKKFQEKKDWPSENGAPYAITIPLQYNSSTGNSLIEQIHTFLTDAKKESEIKYNALLDILPMTAELLHNYAPNNFNSLHLYDCCSQIGVGTLRHRYILHNKNKIMELLHNGKEVVENKPPARSNHMLAGCLVVGDADARRSVPRGSVNGCS